MFALEGTGMSAPLLQVSRISKSFATGRGTLQAVEDVSFTIAPGEAFGLVGESGSGKSTLGRLALGLIAPTSGNVSFSGQSIIGLSERALKPFRRQAQMVFQDPYSSLNPRLRIKEIIGEALDTHGLAQDRRDARIAELLDMVGLNASHAARYPHEFSGGQRQRIGIARALAVEPRLLIADEPVSALDVSVQAQIITLLQDLRRHLGLALLFISHDLEIVELLCERVAVLYLGRVMETGPTHQVMQTPRHPYSRALLAAVPKADPEAPRVKRLVSGDIPSQWTLTSNVDDIAQAAQVSAPTIVRFCRAVGCEGLKDFKLKLAAALARGTPYLHRDVTDGDSGQDVLRNVVGSVTAVVAEWQRQIDPGRIEAAASLINQARRVDCFGTGATSNFLAQDLQARLFRFDISSTAYTDAHLQMVAAATLQPGDVVVAISFVGRMPSLLEVVRLAKKRGAKIIAITRANTPLAQFADEVLATDVPRDAVMRVGTDAYIVQLLLIEVLMVMIGLQRGPALNDRLKTIHDVLERHGADIEADPLYD